MTNKRVRLSEKVHERLLYLKEQTHAKSLNDVIWALILIAEEQYLTEGTIKAENKEILLKYDDGQLVEIEIKKQ